MKQKNIALKLLAAVLSAVTAVSTVLFAACSKKENIYTIPESKLPTEEQFALKKYDYENLSDVQTTVRADVRNVLQRNLPRAKTEYLSDDFSLVYDSENKTLSTRYGALAENSETVKTATIHFDKYPSPSSACSGAGAFSNGTMNGRPVSSDDSAFYKYMLMTQGQHLTAEAAYLSANGELTQEWLKKHRAADAQYGAVLGENNAVKKEIILDPIYRSYHATGLYLPAGEAVTVNVEGLKTGERISVFLGLQDSLAWRGGANDAAFNAIAGNLSSVKATSSDAYFTKADVLVANGQMSGNVTNQSQWNRQNARMPWLHANFTFTENREYTIGTPFGGLIVIGMDNCYSRVKTTFTGAVETPHYVLGQTTPEYFDEYLRNAPGVIAILDTENGELVGPTGEMGTHNYMRQVKKEEIDKLAMLWHSFLSVNESFTGGTYNRFNKIMFDWHVPAGAAVALGNYSFAQPTGWFNDAMNYRGLLSRGTWGTLHEIGHNHSASYGTVWGFGTGREGEVRNNALTLLSYIMFCDVGTTVRNGGGAEHGAYANPYNTLMQTLQYKDRQGDFDDGSYDYFRCLGMYANIMHSFGAEKYYELLYTYKENHSYCSNKRADFAYRCSLVYGMDFRKYFNTFYCANIEDGFFTEEQLAVMQKLPKYEPVSCYYAGGIDGVKTSGDYIVTFGDDLSFDLLNTTVSSLDTPDKKGFEIIKVNQPLHGKIRKGGDGKWIYSFNKKYTGVSDEFTFDVKLADGVVHTLVITLRIAYNGGRISVYNDVQGNNFDEIFANVAARQPDEILGSSKGSIPTYQTAAGKKDVRIAEFYWQAPQSGTVSLSAKWDDWAKIYFGESFDKLEEILSGTHDIGAYQEYNVTKTVEKGKFYAVKIFNVNTGGGGSASLAYKYGDGAYAEVNPLNVFHPAYPIGQTAPTFIYEPQFLVSKKDSIKLSSAGTDKAEWKVVTAPENVNDGRYVRQQLIDPDTGKPLEGEESVLITDKWDWLIDGQTSTIFHTAWQAKDGIKPPTPENPDVFIIDTAKVQSFNYFTVTTRLTQNDDARITSYELLISDDNEHYTAVSSGESLAYVNANGTKVAKLDFGKAVTGRYWKLIVKGTSGKNFTIVSELDAGVQSATQQVISPTSSKLFATKGWKNSAAMDDQPNGYLISQKKNQKLVIKFKGESFAVYAATGKGYGSANVYIDGKNIGSFNLNSETEDSRKLVFYYDNLKNKEHTVEIITTSSEKVMLSIFGIPYSASLMNATNIYKEKALTIALVIFLLLFVAVAAFVAVLIFVPKFREIVFGNRFIKKLDEKTAKPKPEAAELTAAAEVAEAPKPAKAKTAAKTTAKPAANKTAKPTAKPSGKPTANKTVKPKK